VVRYLCRMAKRIKIVGKREPCIVNTGPCEPLIDPDEVMRALGGERVQFEDLSPRSQAIVGTKRQ